MEFNERLIRARKDKAMSQEALAEIIGVSRQAVSKWETGEAKPDADKLIAICRALDLSMDQLCLGKEEMPAAELCQPAKRGAWKWVVCLVGGLLIGGLLMGVMCMVGHRADGTEELRYLLENVGVEDFKVESFSESGTRYLRIKFVPSVQVDGMEVGYMVVNHASAVSGKVQQASKAGAWYQFAYPQRTSGSVDVYAVFTLDGVQVQVKMSSIGFDENGHSYTHDWEES